MSLSDKTSPTYKIAQVVLVVVGVILLVVMLRAFGSAIPDPVDWSVFRSAVWRLLQGEDLYQNNGYFYAPWVAISFIPFGVLDFFTGRYLFLITTIVIGLMIAKQYELSLVKTLLFLLSPPAVYTYLFAQSDLFLLGILLIPNEWWWLLSISKPQLTLGLFFAVPQKKWKRAFIIGASITSLSLLWFGLWPLKILNQNDLPGRSPVNLVGDMWPWTLIGAAIIIFIAYRSTDENRELIFLAASPFMIPYVNFSNLLGIWLALSKYSKRDWPIVVLFILVWVVPFLIRQGSY